MKHWLVQLTACIWLQHYIWLVVDLVGLKQVRWAGLYPRPSLLLGADKTKERRRERKQTLARYPCPFSLRRASASAVVASSSATSAMATSPALLFPSPSSASSAPSSARVEAVVLFNVCDSYVRRPDQADRVIGTLLGSLLSDGTVHVRNSYVVPHSESADQVGSDHISNELTRSFALGYLLMMGADAGRHRHRLPP